MLFASPRLPTFSPVYTSGVFSPPTACVTPSGTMNMGRKFPPSSHLVSLYLSTEACAVFRNGNLSSNSGKDSRTMELAYVDLEVPQGLWQCIRRYSIPTRDFGLITMVS